jgi:ubiquinone/menaquinone biosynthesis C-methylase UbiE
MQLMHADISEVDFESTQFDAIIASYSLFHISVDKHKDILKKFDKWLCPNGKALFTYATEEYTGSTTFDGYKNFMGQALYYSHKNPDELYVDLEDIGFNIDSIDYRNIGGETFLWVTVSKRPV